MTRAQNLTFTSLCALVLSSCLVPKNTSKSEEGQSGRLKGVMRGGAKSQVTHQSDWQSMRLRVVGLSLKSISTSVEPGSSSAEDPWFKVSLGPTEVDPAQLADGLFAIISRSEVQEGTYSQVRLILDLDESYVISADGSHVPLVVPSGEQSGLKIHCDTPLTIAHDHLTIARLDAELDDLVHPVPANPNATPDHYVLRPSLKCTGLNPIEIPRSLTDLPASGGDSGSGDGSSGSGGDSGSGDGSSGSGGDSGSGDGSADPADDPNTYLDPCDILSSNCYAPENGV